MREVKGTLFVTMVPERRTQMACGVAHSRRHHLSRTDASIGSGDVPFSSSVEGEEGSYNKFSVGVAHSREVVVCVETGFPAESDPSPPDSVSVFVRRLLF